ncbi:uncharacterized protein LOC5507189 isoform X3 [Nematostella vectensis]|uniref:uncharacterized protein LOC5507189 isoform X3 n=1 Tax=Nematostella vectensis TaxID=45351 RepID=UPI002077729E|nr:uncharacterized protein LOC5507189 isoform X3 [Nematostella vectensis]
MATGTFLRWRFGDIHAVTDSEKWYSILCMLIGIAYFFGLLLGSMASIITNLDAMRASYNHHLTAIKQHMQDLNISKKVQERVVAYYEYLWLTTEGVNTQGIFKDLPVTLQTELALSINNKVLEKAEVFKDLSAGSKRMLTTYIKPVFFMPDQVIINKGDVGSAMYYIHRGKVEALSEDGVKVVLEEGHLFGEVTLVYNILRTTVVRAITPCVICVLERQDMNKVLNYYPKGTGQSLQKLHNIVEDRCEIVQSKGNSVLEMTTDEANHELLHTVGYKEPTNKGHSFWQRLTTTVIHPHSKKLYIWERVHLGALVLTFMLNSFVASFSVGLHHLGYGENIYMNIILFVSYILDAILICDFLLRFNLATAATSDLKKIRANYIRTKLFWLDLLAIIPIEIIAFGFSGHFRWHMLSFLKLNRFFKIGRLVSHFEELENRFDSSVANIRGLKYGIYILLTTHISACLWIFEACYGDDCQHGSWAEHVIQIKDSIGLREYVASMYWSAAAMSSTGYGDIHAHDALSEIISIIVMFTGLLLYGYCLCGFSATIANTMKPKAEFQERVDAAVKFMTTQNLDSTLIQRVIDSLSMVWKMHRGENIPGSKRLMADMPVRLQQEVCAEECTDLIKQVPIFVESDENFMRTLSLHTTSYVFKPGDYIVYAGDMGREMYCIRRGQVNILCEDNVIGTLGPGSFFGEIGLIYGESRFATVQAKTYCQILMLTKHDLDEVLEEFPIIKRQITEAGARHAMFSNKNQNKTRKAIRRLSLEASQRAQASRVAYKNKLDVIKAKKKNYVIPESEIEKGDSDDADGADDEVFTEDEIRRVYQDMAPVARIFSCLLMRKGISPKAVWFRVWQGITTTIAGFYLATVVLQAAILHIDITFWTLHYCFEIVFLADIYIKFHVGYYSKNKVLVTHPVYTARKYLRGNFVIDVLASFPTEIFILASMPLNISILRILAFVRLNRCIHFYRLVQFFSYMEEPLGYWANFYRQLKFVIYMSLFTHYVACGWFILACDGQDDGSHLCRKEYWAMSSGHSLKKDDPVFERYLISFYWAAATCASVGYGDIRSYQVSEMTYSFFFIVIGIVFYGYIVASVAAGLANADAQRARFQERLDSIKDFLQEENINEHVKSKIINHYEYTWLRNRGVDSSTLFEGIPLSLHADITISLYKDAIEKVPLFQNKDIGFVKMLSLHVKPIYFLSNEYIVQKGEIGHEMFFIHKGEVDVVTDDDPPIVLTTLKAGSFFGENSVLFDSPRTASVRARINCDVYVLTKNDMAEVLSHYPEIKEEMLRAAEENERLLQEKAALATEALPTDDDQRNCETPGLAVDMPEDEGVTVKTPRNCCGAILNFLWVKLSEFVIEPDSKLHYITFLNCALIFLTSITITFTVAFQEHALYIHLFNYAAELCFFVEIFFKFNMAYRLPTGVLETDQRRIATHYVKEGFIFDFVASFPLEIFALAAPEGSKLEVLSYLRLTHLLRILRLSQFFNEYGNKLNINVFEVRMTKFVLYVILTVHMFACGWYFMDCPGNKCDPKERYWLDDHGLRGEAGLTIYVSALYWVVASVTTTGYGDIHADNNNEMIYASFVMVGGKLLFGFILSNIASTLSNLEMKQFGYRKKLEVVKHHLKKEMAPVELQERVINFYEFIWFKNKGAKFSSLFYDIPHCLGGELAMELVGDVLKKVPVLSGASDPFIRLLSAKAQPCQIRAGEYIIRKGDIGQQLIILKRGTAAIVKSEDPEKLEEMVVNSFYGQRYLLLTGPYLESVRAITNVDVFLLDKKDLYEVLKFDQVTKQRVQQAVADINASMQLVPAN